MTDMNKKGRGRPVGSNSTVRVKLKDLRKYLTDESIIVVGKTWLSDIGIGIDEAKIVRIKAVKETEENTIVETKELC